MISSKKFIVLLRERRERRDQRDEEERIGGCDRERGIRYNEFHHLPTPDGNSALHLTVIAIHSSLPHLREIIMLHSNHYTKY